MPDILVRGLTAEAVTRIDAEAAELGLSRNEFLRRTLEGPKAAGPAPVVTDVDWRRSAHVFEDLADPAIMDAAWR